MRTLYSLVLILVLIIPSWLGAASDSTGPFGFNLTTHPLRFPYCTSYEGDGLGFTGYEYLCSSAPRPHPDFPSYLLVFIKPRGLCALLTHGEPQDHVEQAEQYLAQLTAKYGPPTSSSQPSKQRWIYTWSGEEGFQGVGPVTGLVLEIDQHGVLFPTSIHSYVRFWFPTSCKQALRDQANSAF